VGSVDSSQDQVTEEEIETRNLLNGYVLRTAQIDQQKRRTDYEYARRIEEEATNLEFERRGGPTYDVGRRVAETSKSWSDWPVF
jgi:hypothetical protein